MSKGSPEVKKTDEGFVRSLELEEGGRRLKLSFSNPSPSSISQRGASSAASSVSDFPSESRPMSREVSSLSIMISRNEESQEAENRGEEGEKGRSVSHRHVASSSNDALGSVAADHGNGGENMSQGASTTGGENPQGVEPVGVQRPSIYITPWGERYHTNVDCQSLRRTRRLIRSPYCPICAGDATLDGSVQIFATGPGAVVHYDRNCPRGTGARGYLRCGLCRNRG